ncbi:suppressor of cytokine signaling 7-like isoform X2 [Polyodon spathula]|uniref:suppressor of cytokine signaling 7-like isoform X2 n=1 Tax=Polyodon spathula TaxID=7913 RepID=UPI001B7EE070|nr:suppressor of cytokine signaling 7-like isoform X2 [Polyodon spathula]
MNNTQADINMSPDFVLMRLVSDEDGLDKKNANLSAAASNAFGAPVLLGQHHNNGTLLKNGFEFDANHKTTQEQQQQQTGNWAAESPEDAMPTTRPLEPLVPPPPADTAMARRLDFHRRNRGSRPQLMVFRNLLRPGGSDHHGPGQHGFQMGGLVLESHGRCSDVSSAGFSSSADPLQPGRFLQPQIKHQPRLDLVHPRQAADSPTSTAPRSVRPELRPRHRLTADDKDWPPASERLLNNEPDHRDLSDTSWGSSAPGGGGGGPGTAAADPVFKLARKFGEFVVDGAAVLFSKEGELPRCHCQSLLGSAGVRPGEDPTETSDVLLVLEGLELEEMDGLGMSSTFLEEALKNGTAALLNGTGDDDVMQKMNGFSSNTLREQAERAAGASCCPGSPQPQVCCPLRDGLDLRADVAQLSQPAPDERSPLSEHASNQNDFSTRGPTLDLPAAPQDPNHKVRVSRCASSPLTVASGGGSEKTAREPGKSRKGSLKVRLSKLFRTRSCNGSGEREDKRHSVDSTVAAGSLDGMDISGSKGGQDPGRKPRLTTTLSAFSPASFSPVFTGETVSLVDVDISRRGLNSSHPPTPPPPPRRSLSLLDAFLRALPRPSSSSSSSSSSSCSLQGDPQLPVTQPPPARVLHCPLSRPDSCSFAASLRELEKCGWYWGPMNWEDAEMKLKGKPDGSFLVRDSSDPRYILSLSFRSQAITHHTRMEHYRGTFSLWCHPKFEDRCQSVVEFIERAVMHSKSGKFLYFLRSRVPGLPPTPVQLLYPVSRFSNVKSLQHLSRFRIRQLVRVDHIPELPLPKPLIAYLRKFYYYDPEEETYLSLKESQDSLRPEEEAEAET